MEALSKKLAARKNEHGLRALSDSTGLIDFSSNDYLGFAADRDLQKEIADYIEQNQLGHGSGGSRLISGNTQLAEELEKNIAAFHGGECALIFNSGYDANLGLLSAVAERGDTIIYDQLVHASIRDGIRLSLANSYSFTHNDLEDLEAKAKNAKGEVWIAVESIYSMDGDMAPLSELADFCETRGYRLIVDEAHAAGVFGKNGEGLVFSENLQKKVWARVVTFGKALGAHGAAVIGSKELVDYLINFSRPFIYSTALPQSSLAAIKLGYQKLPQSGERREILFSRVSQFLEEFKYKELLIPSKSQIQALVIPGNERVLKLSKDLKQKGLSLHAIRSPTVPKDSERIRISFHSFNGEEHIRTLVESLHYLCG